jgi:hypothetical protein
MPNNPPITTNPQQLSSSPAIANTLPISSPSSIALPPMNLSSSTAPGQLQQQHQQQQQQQQQQSGRSLNQLTNSISNIAGSADALNQDIDDLGISLQALAQHLGFDPTKANSPVNDMNADDQKLDDEVEGDLLDMDEFLNTYGMFHAVY